MLTSSKTQKITRHRLALLGEQIGSSFSPAVHQAEAAALNLNDFSYECLDLGDVEDVNRKLGEIMRDLQNQGYTGFNVTQPYKQMIIPFLDELSPVASALGAVNVVSIKEGRRIGHNTDHTGFLGGLRRTLPVDSARRRVVQFGAGGAGAAVAHALCDYGVENLFIIDPDYSKLSMLQKLLKANAPQASVQIGASSEAESWVSEADGVVNATPVGMAHLPGSAVKTALLRAEQWVAEVIYRPVQTELLNAARSLGCQTVPGTAMFIEQAAHTFELLTNIRPDSERMRRQLDVLLTTQAF
ncbi:shikimate dehydrogenase [Glutamicibacter sp. V16R2B1]|uniref:shikimate dehydrogenase n=1 Tax=Glutamicibacter sp. V16R2B1 TaxID=2036207 RepID=UPI0010FD93FF|nr:shikimate dehydrogenase [Glutamicibacter sp. V16R2B1]TLK56541.1 shikimate dehydrogenase [Glutamicibacter sp. V16R2B1]